MTFFDFLSYFTFEENSTRYNTTRLIRDFSKETTS